MRKTRYWTVIFFILTTMLFYSLALAEKEDTAQLTFRKTAVSKNLLATYTVQKATFCPRLSIIYRALPEKISPIITR